MEGWTDLNKKCSWQTGVIIGWSDQKKLSVLNDAEWMFFDGADKTISFTYIVGLH